MLNAMYFYTHSPPPEDPNMMKDEPIKFIIGNREEPKKLIGRISAYNANITG